MNEISIKTLILNSCIETNLGMPLIYLIFYFSRKYFNEDLSKINAKKEQPQLEYKEQK